MTCINQVRTDAGTIVYRPEIDGLRALAILPVIAFHLGATWLPGGFVGVDVFFVISGYLITAIILKEHSVNAFTLKNFWLRRVRRILPGLLLMLAATLVAGNFILLGGSRASLGWQGISTVLLSANTMMWHLAGDYWAPAAGKLPLLHAWSLSLEEQFYLIYPLFILVALRRFPRKLTLSLAGIFLLSLAFSIYYTSRLPSVAFYSLTTRAWELAAGCFLAALGQARPLQPEGSASRSRGGSPAVFRSLAMLGLALIVASCFALNEDGFPGYKALMPVLGSVLVIQFAGTRGCVVASVLSFPAIRFIGKISYSLYLWHWPVIVLANAARVRWEGIPAWTGLPLIPVLAVAAYYTVERPGRRLRHPLSYVLPGAGAVVALCACLAFTKTTYNTSKFAPTVWIGDTFSVAPDKTPAPGPRQGLMDGITIPPRDVKYTHAWSEGGILKQYGGGQVDVLLLGDSHALMWAPVIDAICQECRLTVLFYAAGGVEPLPSIPPKRHAVEGFSPEEWMRFDSNRMSLIRDRHPRLIIIAGHWRALPLGNQCATFLEAVSNLNRSGNAASRSDLLFIEDPVELALDGLNAPQFCATTSSTTIKPWALSDQQAAALALRALLRGFDFAHTVQTADLYLTNGGMARIRDGNSVLYFDDNHLSLAGASLAKERIRSAMTNIMRRPGL